ncbi:MAG: hypothetical protein A2Z72_04490 [Omnitrophica bacterium RBG_13_46_9]|nr:MAG: hypothetical protein A2Z72_04490 [Omnitrophica bacterium RBG_13_46_9]
MKLSEKLIIWPAALLLFNGCAILNLPCQTVKAAETTVGTVGKVADAAGRTVAAGGQVAGKIVETGGKVAAAIIKTPGISDTIINKAILPK